MTVDPGSFLGKSSAAAGFDPSQVTFGGNASASPTSSTILVNSGRQATSPTFVNPPHGTGERVPTSTAPTSNVMVPADAYLQQLDKFYYTIGYKPAYDQVLIQLRNAGYVDPWKQGQLPDYGSVRNAYAQMLTEASYNPNLTPEQYLQAKASIGFAEKQAAKDAPPLTSTDTATSTTSQVDLTNRFDAHALLNSALSQYLGRRATDTELKNFRSLLASQEQANPNVSSSTRTTTSTAVPNADGTASTSSTSSSTTGGQTSGGVNQQQIAKEYAQSLPGYAETQANTTLMSWLEEAIRSGGSNVGAMI